jgi:hypothetical protein
LWFVGDKLIQAAKPAQHTAGIWVPLQFAWQVAWRPPAHCSILCPYIPAAGQESTPVVEQNLENTSLWGEVQSVVEVDKEAMLALVRFVASQNNV